MRLLPKAVPLFFVFALAFSAQVDARDHGHGRSRDRAAGTAGSTVGTGRATAGNTGQNTGGRSVRTGLERDTMRASQSSRAGRVHREKFPGRRTDPGNTGPNTGSGWNSPGAEPLDAGSR